jgi:hypothetical protein
MSPITKKRLIKILHSDDFEGILELCREVVDKWNDQNVIGSTEYETLKMLFMREGKKQGLKEFFDAFENPE